VKTTYKKIFSLLVFLSYCTVFTFAQAQPSNGGQATTVQPKIMVIPYVKDGEDIRTILEEDVNRRVAITKIKEAFDSRDYNTVDFTAKLKAAKDNKIINSNNQTDIKTQILEMSGADIYVQAEVIAQQGQSGSSVRLILTGFEISTGNSLSNKVGESGKFYTDDIGKLASKAVESIAEDFLNVMQTKFTDIVNNGRSIIVEISFAQDSQYNMSSELGTQMLPLSDQLEEWMSESAYKNNYHIQGVTDLKMIFDDVRIPLKDEKGRNYNSSKFSSQLYQYLRGMGLEVQRDMRGSTILVTIK
jgi:hypothetical protein